MPFCLRIHYTSSQRLGADKLLPELSGNSQILGLCLPKRLLISVMIVSGELFGLEDLYLAAEVMSSFTGNYI